MFLKVYWHVWSYYLIELDPLTHHNRTHTTYPQTVITKPTRKLYPYNLTTNRTHSTYPGDIRIST